MQDFFNKVVSGLISPFLFVRWKKDKARDKLYLEEWISRLGDLPLRESPRELLFNFYNEANFEDKAILEIGSDKNFLVVKAMLKLGAKEVYAVNPNLRGPSSFAEENVTILKMPVEAVSLPDESIDLIFGCAVLEHMEDIAKVCHNSARILKPGGCIFLQGGPLWGGPNGHHTIYKGVSGRRYYYGDDTSPWDNWEYLSIKNDDDAMRSLAEKGIPAQDRPGLIFNLLKCNHISRKPFSEIKKLFLENFGDNCIISRKETCEKQKGKWFNLAKNFYGIEDLRINGMQIFWRKP